MDILYVKKTIQLKWIPYHTAHTKDTSNNQNFEPKLLNLTVRFSFVLTFKQHTV